MSGKPKIQLKTFRSYLYSKKILSPSTDEAYITEIKSEIDTALESAYDEAEIIPSETKELNDVYKPFDYKEFAPNKESKELRLIDAISEGLKQSMEKHKDLVIMGQDIAEYGGVFKITEGFLEAIWKR